MPDEQSRSYLLEDLFAEACEIPAAAREAYLEQACAGSPDLREEIDELLALADARPELLRPPKHIEPGMELGDYEVIREIGHGGMGVVYEAVDLWLDRRVALKLLPSVLSHDDGAKSRFQHEARLLASLDDPRIATIHRLAEFEGTRFLVLEFVDGRTLAEIIRNDGPLDVDAAIRLATDLTAALETAHAAEIVHRDLKPANLMLRRDGSLKVLDFGIARALGEQSEGRSREGGLEGTPQYMAPEQREGETIDVRTDLWAMGAILYECVTSKRAGTDTEADVSQSLEGVRRSQSSRGNGFAALIESLLRVDPSQRPQTASSVRGILRRLAPPREPWWRRATLRIAAVVFITTIAAAAIAHRVFWTPGPTERVEVRGKNAIVALDDEARTRWTFAPPGQVGVAPPFVVSSTVPKRVFLTTVPTASGKAGRTWMLDARNGDVLWSEDLSWTPPVNEQARLMVDWSELFDTGRYRELILFGATDGPWYSGCVQAFTLDGERVGTYYHPGPLTFSARIELPEEDEAGFIVFGSNSSARHLSEVVSFAGRVHCGAVAILQPSRLEGQAFPYGEGQPNPRDWPSMPHAKEYAYLLIPPIHPNYRGDIRWARLVPSDSGEVSIEAATMDGRFYRLGQDLYPKYCYASVNSPADSLIRSGRAHLDPPIYFRSGVRRTVDLDITW